MASQDDDQRHDYEGVRAPEREGNNPHLVLAMTPTCELLEPYSRSGFLI